MPRPQISGLAPTLQFFEFPDSEEDEFPGFRVSGFCGSGW
jgi:hypothetical protein